METYDSTKDALTAARRAVARLPGKWTVVVDQHDPKGDGVEGVFFTWKALCGHASITKHNGKYTCDVGLHAGIGGGPWSTGDTYNTPLAALQAEIHRLWCFVTKAIEVAIEAHALLQQGPPPTPLMDYLKSTTSG